MRLFPRRRPKVEKLKQAGDVDGLSALLDYTDRSATVDGVVWDLGAPVRAEAVAALRSLSAPGADEALVRAVADGDMGVRRVALDALAEREGAAAVDALLDAVVTWPYPSEHDALEKAVATLVAWEPEGLAERYVRRLLSPGVPEVDDRHEDALAAFVHADPGGDAAGAAVADLLAAQLVEPSDAAAAARAQRLLLWLGAPAADSVLRSLDGERAGPAAIRAAGLLRDSRAVEPLVGLLSAPDFVLRSEAATALGQLNDTRAVNALIGATQDPEHRVRDCASDALNTMGVAAVIVGVASVMREAVREQLTAADGSDRGAREVGEGAVSGLPPGAVAPPPTWAQEVLSRLLKRAGGSP